MKKLLGLAAVAVLMATSASIALAGDHEAKKEAVEAAKEATAAAGEAAAAATDAAKEADAAAEAADMAVEAAADATEAAGEAAIAHEAPLADGTIVTFDGDMAFVTDEKGEKVAAPDGDHTLADGSKLTVKEGKVTAGMPEFKPAVKTPEEGEVEGGMAPAEDAMHEEHHEEHHEEKAAE